MGYNTDFLGSFEVIPPMDGPLIDYIYKLSTTRRLARNFEGYGTEGEYYVGDDENNILNINKSPSTQPGLWCQWVPTEDGKEICWDAGEKFYDFIEWIQYIAENFIFPTGRVLDGSVIWQGEDIIDRGKIIFNKNSLVMIIKQDGREEDILVKLNPVKNEKLINSIIYSSEDEEMSEEEYQYAETEDEQFDSLLERKFYLEDILREVYIALNKQQDDIVIEESLMKKIEKALE